MKAQNKVKKNLKQHQTQESLNIRFFDILKSDKSNWVFPGISIIVGLLFVFSFGKQTNVQNNSQLNLEQAELNLALANQIQSKAQSEAPRYGLQNQTVNQEQVTINLRDNGFEDGDLVTLTVNERVIVSRHSLLNSGTEIPVSLKPGVNLVKIYGDFDGMQNGMGISLAADVSNQGNATNVLYPQGATAAFNIIRR